MTPVISQAWQNYFAITQHVASGPVSISWFVAIAALPIALMIPPSVLSHRQLASIFLPIIFASVFDAWWRLGGFEVISADALWWSSYLLVFKDPRKDFKRIWHIGTYGRAGNDPSIPRKDATAALLHDAQSEPKALDASTAHVIIEEGYPVQLNQRLAWIGALLLSRPLSGWKISDHPRPTSQVNPWPPRRQLPFVIDIVQRLILATFVLIPLTLQLAKDDPYFTTPGYSAWDQYTSESDKAMVSWIRLIVPRVLLRPLTLGVFALSLLNVMFLLAAPLPVITNALFGLPVFYWSPHSWASHFGSFHEGVLLNGVRGFWGTFWHQQMRHMVSEPGKYLANKIGIPRKSIIRYTLMSISAFFLSGITHVGLVPPHPLNTKVSTNVLRLHFAVFFWIQPIGILFEYLIFEPLLAELHLKKLSSPHHTILPVQVRLGQLIRLIWVLIWMAFSCSFLVLPYGQLNFWAVPKLLNVVPKLGFLISGEWLP